MTMIGSEKQIKWAMELRESVMPLIAEARNAQQAILANSEAPQSHKDKANMILAVLTAVESHRKASDWIDAKSYCHRGGFKVIVNYVISKQWV